jgi:hypothetical protein
MIIKIESPKYDVGYHTDMVRNGVIKTSVHYINTSEISSISHYIGKNLHKGWDCSKVKMNNGDSFIDARHPNELFKSINL